MTGCKSSDGGKTFKVIGGYGGSFNLHPDLQSCVSIGNDAWIATDGGLTYSTDFFTDTKNAVSLNKGLYGSDFWGFDAGWNEKVFVGGRFISQDGTVVIQLFELQVPEQEIW